MSLYHRLHGSEKAQTLPLQDKERERLSGLKADVQKKLARDLGGHGKLVRIGRDQEELLREKIGELLSAEEGLSTLDKESLSDELMATIIGLGPIQPLVEDGSVSEIMVNGKDEVFIERAGRITKTDIHFQDDKEIMDLIERIVAPLGRRLDEQSPMVDARLKDGSRVNAIIPPLALKGPTITIRKFPQSPLGVTDLIRNQSMSQEMATFLQAAVRARLNVVVSGGTASGKTTLLNCLSSFIPGDERIITIEDAAELRLQQEHIVSLETRPPNVEGRGEITIRNLVKNALRMRPDRIIVGEVRSGEALDMLQAMNTGHDGSLTTVHANGPREVLSRIETMVLMAGIDLPLRAIREQISSAVHLIVQISRAKDGHRRVTHVTEIQGLEGDVIVLQDLFTFDQESGRFMESGFRPKAHDKIRHAGGIIGGAARLG